MKSVLLGSAAGVVAVSGTQAADLPVKAKPVEYVKICTLYGAGFYYIPGTDICLKIGGYIRADYGYNVRAGTQHYAGADGAQDRTVSAFSTRHRLHFNFDSRTQTPYGTLRTYAATNIDNRDQGTVLVTPTRAFIQWAGFTFGRTVSFTDVPGTPSPDTFKSLHQTQTVSETGANGTNQIAYTWELGNGMTLNIGADERRVRPIANLSNNAWTTIGTDPTDSHHGMQFPTPYVNFSANQDWGRFGLSAIFNQNTASYYRDFPALPCVQTGTDQCGSPDDKWGFAVLTGIDIKAPWLGPGDHFGGYFNYGQGATRFAGGSSLSSPGLYGAGTIAFGVVTDAVYVDGSNLELTTAWTAGVGYEHFWLPNFSTTWYGTYTEVSYNDTVINGRWFCGGAGAQGAVAIPAAAPCDPGFRFWTVGTHTDWYPVRGFRLAVDVLYTRIETAFDGQVVTLTSKQGARQTGTYLAKDDGILSVVFRAERRFASGGD